MVTLSFVSLQKFVLLFAVVILTFSGPQSGVSRQVSAALTGPLHFIADVAVVREE